jgi:hypothetical protein
MNLLAHAILDFLEDHDGYYLNSHSIEFGFLNNSITADYAEVFKPQNKHIELCLHYSSRNIQKFMRDFAIASSKDLDSITNHDLWRLFRSGAGEISCYIEDHYDSPFLTFSYENGNLITRSNDGEEYIVTESLASANDFANYTLLYFEKLPE